MKQKSRIVNILLFFVIIGITFSVPTSSATINDDQNIFDNQNLKEINQVSKLQHVLKLYESISVVQNKENNHNQQSIPSERIGILKLVENISLDSHDNDYTTIINLKHESDKQTTKERIYNLEKLKTNSKLLNFIDDFIVVQTNYVSTNLIEIFSNDKINSELYDLKNNFFEVDVEQYFENPIKQFSSFDFVESIEPSPILEIISNVSDPNNPTTFLLLAPLSGVVLLLSEKNNFKLKISRQTQSSALAFLILFSAVSIPLSISDNYWGPQFVFADSNSTNNEFIEIQNNTQEILENNISVKQLSIEITNSTIFESFETNDSIENQTIETVEPVVNATQAIETADNNIDSASIGDSIKILVQIAENYQLPHPTTDSASIGDYIMIFTNGTQLSLIPPHPTTDSASIGDYIMIFTNGTQLSLIPPHATTDSASIGDHIVLISNGTLIEPVLISGESGKPIQIDSASIGDFINIIVRNAVPDADLTLLSEPNTNQTSVVLDGEDDYIVISNSTVTDSVSELTISGWIKPDYTQGSQEFTIVSKEDQFSLSVNNIVTPEHIAKFSIFDGITWTSVESLVEIDEKWTHLGATFNGTDIKIYVNGNQEASTILPGVISLNNGTLSTNTIETISSDSDIVIGGYLSMSQGNGTVTKEFSGSIEAVSIYDEQLDDEQISLIYLENVDYYNSIPTEIDLDAILKEIIAEQTNSTQITPVETNSTQITPVETNSTQITPVETNSTNPLSSIVGFLFALDFQLVQFADAAKMSFDEKLDSDLQNTKSKISEIKSKITAFKENKNLNNEDAKENKKELKENKKLKKELKKELKEIKKELKKELKEIKKIAKQMQKIDKKAKQSEKLDESIAIVESISDISVNATQKDTWKGLQTEIKTEFYDANGDQSSIESELTKARTGLFDIRVLADDMTKPGMYTMKTTLTVNGQEFVSENEFAWGLVSVNTIKSIFKPTEIAPMEIVVLNSTGAPVCDADMIMMVNDPNNDSTSFATQNNDFTKGECGIYNAVYDIATIGNHTIYITADTENGIVDFRTYFMVQSSFDYDVLRDTESKIDPFFGDDIIDVSLEVTSFVGNNPLVIREYVPSFFDVTAEYGGQVEIVGDKKVITWITEPNSEGISHVMYEYSVPLITPQLYAIGKVEIEQEGVPMFTEGRNWYIAVDPLQTVTGTVSGSNDRHNDSSKRTVVINSTHIYNFYIDNGHEARYAYSTDAGQSWTNAAQIHPDGTTQGIAVWYDAWTPGLEDDGNPDMIHVGYFENSFDGVKYKQFDPHTGTGGTISPVSTSTALFPADDDCTNTTGCQGGLGADNEMAITVSTDGDIFIGTVDNGRPRSGVAYIYYCDDYVNNDCETDNSDWTAAGDRNDPWTDAENEENSMFMLPMDGGDIMLVAHKNDQSGSEDALQFKIWDTSGGSWTSSWTQIDSGVNFNTGTTAWTHASSAVVNPTNNMLYIAATEDVNSAGNSIVHFYSADGSSGGSCVSTPSTCWDETHGDVYGPTASEAIHDATVGVDSHTGDIYVAYLRDSNADDNSDIMYKISSDGGDNWGNEEDGSHGVEDYYGGLNMPNNSIYYLTITAADDSGTNIVEVDSLIRIFLTDSVGLATTNHNRRVIIQKSDFVDISDFIPQKHVNLEKNDAINVDDSIVKIVNLEKNDALKVTDSIDKTIIKDLRDTINLTDSIVKSATILKDDTVNVSDVISKRAILEKSDSISISDSIDIIFVKDLTDNISVTDSITKSATILKDDTVTVTDSIAKNVTLEKSDSISISDSIDIIFVKDLTDNISVTDSITKSATILKDDTVTVTDSIAKNVTLEKSDSITVTDSLRRSFVKDLTDNISVTDSITKSATILKDDTVTVTDSIAKNVTLEKSDSITVTDSLRRSFVKDLTDNISVTDSINIIKSITQTLNDSVTVTDSISTEASITQTLNDSVTVTDSISTEASITQTLNDTITVTDSIATTKSITQTLNDAITVTDSINIIKSITQTLNDAITLTDSIATIKSITQTLNDAITVTDSIATEASKTQTLNDAITVTDSIATIKSITQTLNDNISVTDSIATTKSITQTLNDSVTVTDSISTEASITQTLNDSVTVTDSISTEASITQTLNDTITVTDSIATIKSITQTLNDNISVTDSINIIKSITQTLNDAITVTDSIATTKSITQTLNDSVTVTDSISTEASITQTLNDSVTVTDSISTEASITQTLNDTITVTDSIATTKSITQTLNDNISVTDSINIIKSITQTLNDAITVTDSIATTKSITQTLNDTITVTDSIATTKSITQTLNDNISVTDSIATTKSITQTLNDAITVTDSIATEASKTQTLNDAITVTDSINTDKSITQTLNDTITVTDSIATIKSITQTLNDNISVTDSVVITSQQTVQLNDAITATDSINTEAIITQTLNDAITVTDSINTDKSITQTLNDAITVTDSIATIKSITQTLNDNISVTDSIATEASITQTLNDSITATDSINTDKSITQILNDSITATDSIATEASKTQTLNDSITATDSIVITSQQTLTLSDTITATDSIATEASITQTLNDSITATDSINTDKSITQTLNDAITVTDSIATEASKTQTLNDSITATDSIVITSQQTLTLSDTIAVTDVLNIISQQTITLSDTIAVIDNIISSTSITQTLSDTIAVTDVLNTEVSKIQTLSDNIAVTDNFNRNVMFTQTLSDTISVTDSTAFRGAFSIEARSDATTIHGGATYEISPNPFTGTGTLTVIDDGFDVNDSDPTVGIIGISNVPFDDYIIEMTSVPTGYDVTVDSTTVAIWNADASPLMTFTVILDTAIVSDLDPIITTTAPLLNATHIDTLSGFSAILVNQTESTIDTTSDLPEIIGVGQDNDDGISDAIIQQSNLKLITNITPGTSGNSIQDTIGMPSYVLPTDEEFTVVIPATVTQETTTHQIVATPMYEAVIPGQTMIIPVEYSLIQSFGGVSQLEITSDVSSSSIGTFDDDWIVIEIDNEHVGSPTLASSGITNTLDLEIDVKYRYAEDIVGFNWGDENNYESDPILTVLVPVPTDSAIITLENGCADVEVHTLVGGTWTAGIDRVLSNAPSTDNPGFCEIEIESDHYSKKSVSSKRSSSPGSSGTGATGGTGSSGGGGSTGHSTGASGGFGGILSSPLAINEIYYDKCNDNMARILISSDADVPPTVKVSTSKSGVVFATLAEIQPYEDLNKFSTVDRYLYEIPISSDESFMMVVATEEIGTTSNVVQASVKLLACEGTTVIVPLPEDILPEVSESTARIFDTKVQIGNTTPINAAESEFLFINSQDLSVSAIVDSETSLERVELRSITMGQSESDYIAVKMDVTPLYISNSTYVVTGTIPSFFMVEPGMTYWLHITDEYAAQTESIHYNIGAKPGSVSDIAVEVDMPTIKPSGTTVKPEFYLFNEDEPSYGIVSLVVDGEVVSKRSQMFGTGQTQIIFNWNTPKSDGYVEYDIQGIVELYETKISTTSSILATHPKTVTVSSSEMPALQLIQRDGTVLADPALVYASNADSELRFVVTDPQGQCIIGGADECLVNENTRGKRGGLESVPYGDQILRVRYSGADNALERFSITSIDPIIGKWNVSLESEDGFVQQAHASDNSIVKIKYRIHSEIITVFSK